MKKKSAAILLACVLCAGLAACGSTQPSAKEEVKTETSAEGKVYTYTEEASFNGSSFEVPWELTLADDGTYKMVTNGPMGTDTYTGEYTMDGNKVTTGTPDEDDIMIMASWFNNDYSCDWILDDENGTCMPAALAGAESSGASGEVGGKPQIPEGIDQADKEDGLPGGMRPMGGEPFAYDGESYTDVQYAQVSTSDIMDIYLPKTEEKTPVVVMVHGGAFQFGDKQMDAVTRCFRILLDNGYAVATVNYRLAREAVYPGAVADVKAAVRFLKANADMYRIDADNVYIWGESAGAYLACMTAVTPEIKELDGDVTDNGNQSSSVKALISFFAPVDWYHMDQDFADLGVTEADRPMGLTSTDKSAESMFLGQNVSADEAATSEANPLMYVGTMNQETLYAFIEHGDADTNVPYVQSERLYDALSARYGEDKVSLTILEGAAHEDDAFYIEENLNKVIEFLNTVPR